MRLLTAWRLVRYMGARWCAFRVAYALRGRMGLIERSTPRITWDEVAVPEQPAELSRLFVRPPRIEATQRHWQVEADAILAGAFEFYSDSQRHVGFPPDWHFNPIEEKRWDPEAHWSRLPDFGNGDVKAVWELSRCAWAFPLACAYAVGRDEKYADGFWTLFESWLDANPPNTGVNWRCGQEATFRLMACTFAIALLGGAQATTGRRRLAYRRFVMQTGRRIEANLAYALSQSNNHGISECAGLITVALLEPHAAESASWIQKGLRSLQQLEALVYTDGGFAQHSTNYHRVLLDDLVWIIHMLQFGERPVPSAVRSAAGRALSFLDQITDPGSGGAPCWGANDGARILPLSQSPYEDYRPTVQLASAVLHQRRRYEAGPWDETARWFGATLGDMPDSPARPASWVAPVAGLALSRGRHSWGMLRGIRRFVHRPSQADLLHFDLWWRGRNVLIDPGSFSYADDGHFNGALKAGFAHNTVTLEDRDLMQKCGRFLYLPWPRGTIAAQGARVSGSHEGYSQLGIQHRREIEVDDDEWKITDRLGGVKGRTTRLHWLLADSPWEWDSNANSLTVKYPEGFLILKVKCSSPFAGRSVVRADPSSWRGWTAKRYLSAEPALSLELKAVGDSVLYETSVSFRSPP